MRTLRLLVLTLSAPLAAQAQPTGAEVRARLAAVEQDLDQAVGAPAGAHVFGLPARTRSYYLEGYGAVFVLPPRALGNGGTRRFLFHSELKPGLDSALQHLEEGLHRIESPEAREALGRTLADLRQQPAQEARATESGPAAGLRQALEAARSREQAARQTAREASAAALASRAASGPEGSAEAEALERAAAQAEARRRAWAREVRAREQQLRALEAQVEAFRLEAEQARREAERQLDVVTHEIQLRFGTRAGGSVDAGAATPPPVPWAFWYETRTQETTASPEESMARVRDAVTAVLARRGPTLAALRPDDVIVVAVDFVPAALGPSSRPDRTLVVTVRSEVLRQHAAGQLSAEELREHIAFSEY